MTRFALIACAVLGLTVSATPAGVYEGHKLVRVWPATPRDHLALAQAELLLMSEAERRAGGTAYLADERALALLDAAGVRYDVLRADVQAMIDAERARLDARTRWGEGPAPRDDDAFFAEYRDFEEINLFLDQLVADHPGLVSRQTIGQSIEGRDIEAFTISGEGDPDAKRSLVFHAMIHAREWISPMTVLYIMRGLADGYDADPRVRAILDSVTFRIIPVLNPDGYVYSWTAQRLWRKNRRGGYGVDLNRNFSVGWGGSGSSGSIYSNTYRGEAPFSEPESRALRDYLLSVPNRAVHIDYHSYSQLVMWPPGFEDSHVPPPDGPALEAMGRDYARDVRAATGENYTPQRCVDLYVASGITTDWAFWEAGVFGWTVELRPSHPDFSPPPDQILPCAVENLAGVIGLAESVADGVIASGIEAPAIAEPGLTLPVAIDVNPAFLGSLDGVSADLLWRDGSAGAFTPVPLEPDGTTFVGELPPADCGAEIEFYAEITTPDGTLTVPRAAPDQTESLEIARTRQVIADDMETDAGWTVTPAEPDAGGWELAAPNVSYTTPGEDHTSDGELCWITDARRVINLHAHDVDGVTTLTSPPYDLGTSWDEHFLSFWLWYHTLDEPLEIDISADDGRTWQPLDTVSEITDGWVRRLYPLPEPFASSRAFRVRFTATDLGVSSLVEAAVDDLEIFTRGCGDNPADLAEPFGILDAADITAFAQAFLAQDPAADLSDPRGVIDLADVTAFVGFFTQGAP